MGVPFAKPDFEYRYSLKREIRALRAHRRARTIPARAKDRLLIASWNLANLGLQDRTPRDYALLAEIISWFDLVAVQEVVENLRGLRRLMRHLPSQWVAIFTDRSGNNERLAYLYRADRMKHGELLGEINLLPSEKRRVRVKGVETVFEDFSRAPALCSFQMNNFRFTLGNVHVYFGEASGPKFQRRLLEVMALAVYAKQRQFELTRYDSNLMLIGDFNTPRAEPTDPIYAALIAGGMVPPQALHRTLVGGRKMGLERAYDQLMMFPSTRLKSRAIKGVFDWDEVLFASLWDQKDRAQKRKYFEYVRYHISDHRPLWVCLRV